MFFVKLVTNCMFKIWFLLIFYYVCSHSRGLIVSMKLMGFYVNLFLVIVRFAQINSYWISCQIYFEMCVHIHLICHQCINANRVKNYKSNLNAKCVWIVNLWKKKNHILHWKWRKFLTLKSPHDDVVLLPISFIDIITNSKLCRS